MGKKSGQTRPKKERRSPEEVVLAGQGTYEFTLQSGEVIAYKPINPDLRQAVFDRWPDPEVPTREAKTVDGGVELLPDPADPEYQEELAEALRERSKAMLRLLVVQSLADLEPPEDWVTRQQWILPDWKLPEDPFERKLYWVEHWLLGPLDMGGLLGAALIASALTPEEVERQLRSFRAEMARKISETLVPSIWEGLPQLRVGDDIRGGVGEDTVAPVPADGKEAPGQDSGGAAGATDDPIPEPERPGSKGKKGS